MQQTEFTNDYGRRVIRREWRNTEGELHRTPGPAVENWTVLTGGAHLLSYQAWYLNGKLHREGRPAVRRWHVAGNGTRVVVWDEWYRSGVRHGVGGPSYRRWTVEPDGARTLQLESWRVNDMLHRANGPAHTGHGFYWHGFYWHGKIVKSWNLPWLRRGRSLLVTLAAFTGATAPMRNNNRRGGCNEVSPAWSRDARVSTESWRGGGAGDAVVPMYRSAVGGFVLLCV